MTLLVFLIIKKLFFIHIIEYVANYLLLYIISNTGGTCFNMFYTDVMYCRLHGAL